MVSISKIPIEFLPGFWVSLPEGIQGQGSGFLLAENIKNVFPVGITIPKSEHSSRSWSIVPLALTEIENESYLSAYVRIITESWLETSHIMVIGEEWVLYRILEYFMMQSASVKKDIATRIIKSKMG